MQGVGDGPADHRAVGVAEQGRRGDRGAGDGEAAQQPLQPGRAGVGEPGGDGVGAEAHRRHVAGPGDHRGAHAGGLPGLLGPQRAGHPGRGAQRVDRAVEVAEVGVRAGHDHRDPLGGRQVAEDLADQPAAARVEGEDLPAGGQQVLAVVGARGGQRPEVGVQRLVGGPRPGTGDLGGQGDRVGVVAQGRRGAVQVADHQRILTGQPVLLGGGELGEEGLHGGCVGGGRVGQRAAQRVVLDPAVAAGRRAGDGHLLVGGGGLGGGRAGVGEHRTGREDTDQHTLQLPTLHMANSLETHDRDCGPGPELVRLPTIRSLQSASVGVPNERCGRSKLWVASRV